MRKQYTKKKVNTEIVTKSKLISPKKSTVYKLLAISEAYQVDCLEKNVACEFILN